MSQHRKAANFASGKRTASPLLPTLFDRLCDDRPAERSELPAAYVLTPDGLRENVRRDLAFLLNTVSHDDSLDAVAHPLAAASVLNFGVPPLIAGPLDMGQWRRIETIVRAAIARFESRIDLQTVEVLPLAEDRGAPGGFMPRIQIKGRIRSQPYPLEFTVQSAVDLASGRLGGVTVG